MASVGGADISSHYTVVAKHRPAREAPRPPELPGELVYIWEMFNALDASRQCGMGLNPILYIEIAAYAGLYGFKLEGWEVELIRLLDREYLTTQAKSQPEKVR